MEWRRYGAAEGKRREVAGSMPLRRSAGALLLVTLPEALHTAGGIHELLLPREEGMALAADLQAQLLLRGAGRPGLTAGAVHEDLVKLGVDIRFHGTRDSTELSPPAQPPGPNRPLRAP